MISTVQGLAPKDQPRSILFATFGSGRQSKATRKLIAAVIDELGRASVPIIAFHSSFNDSTVYGVLSEMVAEGSVRMILDDPTVRARLFLLRHVGSTIRPTDQRCDQRRSRWTDHDVWG